jgi:hypothetical protein
MHDRLFQGITYYWILNRMFFLIIFSTSNSNLFIKDSNDLGLNPIHDDYFNAKWEGFHSDESRPQCEHCLNEPIQKS